MATLEVVGFSEEVACWRRRGRRSEEAIYFNVRRVVIAMLLRKGPGAASEGLR